MCIAASPKDTRSDASRNRKRAQNVVRIARFDAQSYTGRTWCCSTSQGTGATRVGGRDEGRRRSEYCDQLRDLLPRAFMTSLTTCSVPTLRYLVPEQGRHHQLPIRCLMPFFILIACTAHSRQFSISDQACCRSRPSSKLGPAAHVSQESTQFTAHVRLRASRVRPLPSSNTACFVRRVQWPTAQVLQQVLASSALSNVLPRAAPTHACLCTRIAAVHAMACALILSRTPRRCKGRVWDLGRRMAGTRRAPETRLRPNSAGSAETQILHTQHLIEPS